MTWEQITQAISAQRMVQDGAEPSRFLFESIAMEMTNEVIRLRRALREYGTHQGRCAYSSEPKCSCGLDDLRTPTADAP